MDRQEAEDLVQEDLRKALKGFSIVPAGTNFRAWIYKILPECFSDFPYRAEGDATVSLDLEDEEGTLPTGRGNTREHFAAAFGRAAGAAGPGATASRLSRGAVTFVKSKRCRIRKSLQLLPSRWAR